jgi:hypothetical protein
MKHIVGRIMIKFAQRHSVWISYRALYPTLWMYDRIWLFVMDVVWIVMNYKEIGTTS